MTIFFIIVDIGTPRTFLFQIVRVGSIRKLFLNFTLMLVLPMISTSVPHDEVLQVQLHFQDERVSLNTSILLPPSIRFLKTAPLSIGLTKFMISVFPLRELHISHSSPLLLYLI